MAYATNIRALDLPQIAALREALADKLARRRVYKTTVQELRSLSDRELADIGVSRAMIRGLAMEAAYGK